MPNNQVKVEIIQTTDAVLRDLNIKKHNAAPYYLKITQWDEKGGDKPQLRPLFFQGDHFDVNRIAQDSKMHKQNDVMIMSGKGKGEGRALSVLLKTKQGDLSFGLSPKGDVKLERVPSHPVSLTLETPGHVKVVQPSDAKDARPHRLEGLIVRSKSFNNEHHITAKEISLDTKSHIQNSGLFVAEDQFNIVTTGKVVNHSQALMAGLKQYRINRAQEVVNDGVIGGTEELRLNIQGKLINNKNAKLISENKMDLTLGKGSQNAGHVISKFLSMTADDFGNQYLGRIVASENANFDICTKIKNEGGIVVKNKLTLNTNDIHNGIHGFIHSNHTIKIRNRGKIENFGELLAKFEMNAETTDIVTHPSSLVLSGNRGYFRISGDAKTDGIIGAKIWTELKAGSLKTGTHSKLGGNGFVRIDAGNLLDNLGEIFGNRYLSLNATKVLNQKATSRIYANMDLKVSTKGDATNYGSMIAGHNAEHDIGRNFENHGPVSADDELECYARISIKNASSLTGKLVRLQTEEKESFIRNLPGGSILAEQNTDIKTDIASNEGSLITKSGKLTIYAKLKFENLTSGILQINDDIYIESKKIINLGLISSLKKINLDAKEIFENQIEGKITSAESLALVCASIIKNLGKIKSVGHLTIQAYQIFQELPESSIISQDKLELLGKFIENSGILSGKTLELNSDEKESFVKNLKEGRIAALQSASLKTDTFNNAGKVAVSEGGLTIHSKVLFENVATGALSIQDAININAGKMINNGTIDSAKKIALDVKSIFENTSTGRITAIESLGLICATVVHNTGNIEGWGGIKVEAQKILQELKTARIISNEKLELIANFAIENAGILSGKSIDLITKEKEAWIKNLADSQLEAENDIEARSEKIQNAGSIKTKKGTIKLKDFIKFENVANGLISAADQLSVEGNDGGNEGTILAKWGSLTFKQEFKNSGLIQTEEKLTLKATQTLWNLRAGKINAKTALELLSDLTVYSEGDILAYQALSVIAPTLNHAAGQIESKKDILFEVVDWMLAGQVKASHELAVTVKNHWAWQASGNFEAGCSKLHLEKGYIFTRSIAQKGSLEFHGLTDSIFWNQTDLSSEQDLIVSGGRVINGVETGVFARMKAAGRFESKGVFFDNTKGGIYAGADLLLDHKNGIQSGRTVHTQKSVNRYNGTVQTPWQESNGTYIASSGNATINSSQGGFIIEHSTLDVGKDFKANVAKDITNIAGQMRVNGTADFTSRHFYHTMLATTYSADKRSYAYALTDKPIFSVGKDCTFNTPVTARGGDIRVGRELDKKRGGIDAQEIEEFDYYKILSYETYRRKSHKWRPGGHQYIKEVWTPRKHHYGFHSANVTASSITGTDPSARYNFASSVHTNDLKLEFYEMKIGNDLDTRNLPNVKQFEVDLKRFYSTTSMLFREGGNPQSPAVISPEVPIKLSVVNVPKQIIVNAIANLDYKSLYDEALEARLISDAVAEQYSRGTLNDSKVTAEEIYFTLRQNAFDYAKKLNVDILTDQQIKQATEPMLVYRLEDYRGQMVKVGKLIAPNGNPLRFGVFAKNAILEGSAGSRLVLSSRLKLEENLKLKVDQFILQQRTVKDYVKAYDRKKKENIVTVDTALPETGILQVGNKLEAEVKFWLQTGGMVKTGKGGAKITIEREAQINALRETSVLQANRGFSVAPSFIPAYMISEGDQEITVTEGGFVVSGISSLAAGTNSVTARDGIYANPKMGEYELPEQEVGKGFNKKTMGGTSTSSLHNEFMAGHDLKLESKESKVALCNTQLASGKKTYLKGKQVGISESYGRETRWCKSTSLRGLQFQKSRIHQIKRSPLLSTICSDDDAIINAQQKIFLSGVQGIIQGSLHANAPIVEIKGAKEEVETYSKTETFGVSFFGSQAIEAITQSRSAKAALKSLMRQDAFVNAVGQLARSRDKADLTVNSVHAFIEGWRLASMVAHACNETDGVKGDLLGNFTDRWGLTSVNDKGERIFNPKFDFSYSKTEERTRETRTISTNLRVSNDIHINGDVVKLKDGTELSAQNIRVIANRLLEISAAEDTFEHSMDQKGASVGTTAREQKSLSVGVNGAQSQTQSKQYKLARLAAAQTMTLESGDEFKAIGADLDALDLAMRANTLTFDSVQNSTDQKAVQWNANVNVSSNSVSGSGGVATSKHHSSQTVNSTAHARRSLLVETNTLKQKGSVIASDDKAELKRADQKAGPVNHIVEDMRNILSTEEKKLNIAVTPYDSFPVLGSYEARKQYEESISRATFAAPNLHGVSGAVNQDLSKQDVKVANHKSSFGIAVALLDTKKIQEDANAMQKTLANLKQDFAKQPKVAPELPKIVNEVKTKNADSKKQMSLKDYAKKVAYEEIVAEIKAQEEKVSDEQIRKAIEKEMDKHVSDNPERHSDELVKLGKSINPNLVKSSNSRKAIDSGIDFIVNVVLNAFIPRAHARQLETEDTQCPIKLESIKENQKLTKKKLFDANFPGSHPNAFMNHAFAVGRGIENACNSVADGIVQVAKHPVDTMADVGVCVWDGANGVAQLAAGVSTDGSRQRNRERLGAIKHQVTQFKNGDSAKKLEMLVQIPSELILGAATGGAAGGVSKKIATSTSKIAVKTAEATMKAGGLAIETPHGVAFQRLTPEFLKARKQIQKGAHLYRAGTQGMSQAAEAQYWGREIPGKSDYAARHGIPSKNVEKLNFVERGSLKPGKKAITRKAPPAHDSTNPGGAIEVVTPASGVKLNAYINTVDIPLQIIGGSAPQSTASRLLKGIIKTTPSLETIGATGAAIGASAAAIEEINKNQKP